MSISANVHNIKRVRIVPLHSDGLGHWDTLQFSNDDVVITFHLNEGDREKVLAALGVEPRLPDLAPVTTEVATLSSEMLAEMQKVAEA